MVLSYLLAQTTDTSSNNLTMEREMQCLFKAKNEPDNGSITCNPKTMAIKCFCHIIYLIVNTGLNALVIQTSSPWAIKNATLCDFPNFEVLSTISEENELEDEPDEDSLPVEAKIIED